MASNMLNGMIIVFRAFEQVGSTICDGGTTMSMGYDVVVVVVVVVSSSIRSSGGDGDGDLGGAGDGDGGGCW